MTEMNVAQGIVTLRRENQGGISENLTPEQRGLNPVRMH